MGKRKASSKASSSSSHGSQSPRARDAPYVICGAGLVGSLLAVHLAKQGHRVELYERRADMRLDQDSSAGRSINLAMSTRGLTSLEQVGLADEVRALGLPMAGRLMHDADGNVSSYMPYGLDGQAILSVSRRNLNERLLTAAEAESSCQVFFEHTVSSIDAATATVTFRVTSNGTEGDRTRKVRGKVIIGTDGAFSAIRRQLSTTTAARFNFSQEYIGHGYKELTIPPTEQGRFAVNNNCLHIWPRGQFMMIALPNQDGSFTCTLFAPWSVFDSISSPEDVIKFFQEQFPDALPIMPTLVDDFFQNPTGALQTIKCSPYHFKDKVVIMGDAAHAIVPFYGQGMNAGFEDCRIFSELVKKHNGDMSKILPEFSLERKPNCDAIAELSKANYIEMRDKVASNFFLLQTAFEKLLHRLFRSSYLPLYTMVAFTNIPYAEVIRRNKSQKACLTHGFRIATASLVGCVAVKVFKIVKPGQVLRAGLAGLLGK